MPNNNVNPENIDDLPDEILLEILSNLSPTELIEKGGTSKRFNNLCSDNQLWKRFLKSDIPGEVINRYKTETYPSKALFLNEPEYRKYEYAAQFQGWREFVTQQLTQRKLQLQQLGAEQFGINLNNLDLMLPLLVEQKLHYEEINKIIDDAINRFLNANGDQGVMHQEAMQMMFFASIWTLSNIREAIANNLIQLNDIFTTLVNGQEIDFLPFIIDASLSVDGIKKALKENTLSESAFLQAATAYTNQQIQQHIPNFFRPLPIHNPIADFLDIPLFRGILNQDEIAEAKRKIQADYYNPFNPLDFLEREEEPRNRP